MILAIKNTFRRFIICCLIAVLFFFELPAIAEKKKNFTPLEPDEILSGGQTTSTKPVNANSFSHSSQNLTFEKEMNFKLGNALFRRLWVSAPSSTKSNDGLGPLFNARACQRCHIKDGRGKPPENNRIAAVSLFLRLSIPPQNEHDRKMLASHKKSVIPDPVYGNQFQNFAIQGFSPEGKMVIEYEEISVGFADGEKIMLRKPIYSVKDLAYGPLAKNIMISPRIAPPMIGMGLLEMIRNKDILALADPSDTDKNGISGKAQIVWDMSSKSTALGRFGWKAGNPTVRQQVAGAFSGDIGISGSMFPNHSGDCTLQEIDCMKAPHGGESQKGNVEATKSIIDLVTVYSQNLAVPARRNSGSPVVLKGKRLFHKAGCASCHIPKFTTGKDSQRPEHSNQVIRPYTDLLLHDMGEGLADQRPEGVANGKEWRTAPLWGIGLTETVSGHTYFLHDGRARNLTEAILWHDGEATLAKQNVLNMAKAERSALLKFLNSL